jgi:hypothetical protein
LTTLNCILYLRILLSYTLSTENTPDSCSCSVAVLNDEYQKLQLVYTSRGGGRREHGITGDAHQDGAQPSCIALALEQPVIREYRHAASARETPL